MPRALWSGAITFGLVNVPVRLYSAVSEHKLHFNFIHEKDDSPIGYQKICKKEGADTCGRMGIMYIQAGHAEDYDTVIKKYESYR